MTTEHKFAHKRLPLPPFSKKSGNASNSCRMRKISPIQSFMNIRSLFRSTDSTA